MSRGMAFVIDMFIVSFIVSIITINFNTTKINNLNKEANDVMNNFAKGDILVDDYIDNYSSIIYDINKASFSINLVYLVVSIVYFIIFQFMNDGATIGKRVMGLRVRNNDGSNCNVIQLFVRSSIVDNIIVLLMEMLLLLVNNNMLFVILFGFINLFANLFMIICVFMVLYRKDNLSLNDILSKSQVIYDK